MRAVAASGFSITEVFSGGAKGADALGELYAIRQSKRLRVFPADWARWGRSAGARRNSTMAEYAHGLIAMPGGSGTADMILKATARGLFVYVHADS